MSMSIAAAERFTGLSRTRIESLINANKLHKVAGGLSKESVERAWAIKNNRSYTTGLEKALPGRTALAVPANKIELGGSMILSDSNDRQDAVDGLANQGTPLGEDEYITGWWRIADEQLERLMLPGTLVFGVVGGLVYEIMEYTGVHYTDPWTNRRALVVRMPSEDTAKACFGDVGRMNQGVAYVHV